MSLTYTVTEVSDKVNDYDGRHGKTRYFKFKFRDSDGGESVGSFGRLFKDGQPPAPPQVGYEFVANGQFNQDFNEWKFTQVKTPEQAAKFSSGSSGPTGSSANHDDKMRSKEQCMRGEAIQAAASIATSAEEALRIAPQIEAYIVGTASAPQSDWSSSAPPVAADEQIPF